MSGGFKRSIGTENCVALQFGVRKKDTVNLLVLVVPMLNPNANVNSATECWKSRISYIKADDIICIEHFSEDGHLLSEVKMNYDDAYKYAQLLLEVVDKSLGI